MSIEQIIKQRVSQKDFKDKPIELDALIELLDVAVYAPNHKMREPWRFILLDAEGKEVLLHRYLSHINIDPQAIDKIKKAFHAPNIVIFVMPHQKEMKDEIEDLQAISAVIQNFLLLLTENGMGSFWKTPSFIESDLFKETMGVLENEMIAAWIQVGYPEIESKPKPRQSAKSKTTIYS